MRGEKTIKESDIIEKLEFLARSSNRVKILEILTDTTHAEKDELQAIIEADRTTVSRNLNALEERGWIRADLSTCTLTPAGRDITTGFLDLVETTDIAVRFQEFFAWLPADEFDLDIRALTDAEMYTPESGDPYAMINRHVEQILEADSQRVLLPVIGLHGYEAGHEKVINDESDVELVVEPDVAETIQTDPYKAYTDEMATTDRFEVYVYPGSIPYGLCLLDETVQIFVDEDRDPRAMVETDAGAVHDWAEQTYETYKSDATRLI